MRFNDNSKLAGQHSFLSASSSGWSNYDDDKLDRVYLSRQAAKRGTDFHDLAQRCITLNQRLPEDPITTMGLYVNDAIGFRMKPEVTLFYSINAFCTADAISFRKNELRIHDLKMGLGHTTERQLEVYAAYFCLEYGVRPFDIKTELRIYQNNEIRIYAADPITISLIMDKIVTFDKRINQLREDSE